MGFLFSSNKILTLFPKTQEYVAMFIVLWRQWLLDNVSVVYSVLEKAELRQEEQWTGPFLNVCNKGYFTVITHLAGVGNSFSFSDEILIYVFVAVGWQKHYRFCSKWHHIIWNKIMKWKGISEQKTKPTLVSCLARMCFLGGCLAGWFVDLPPSLGTHELMSLPHLSQPLHLHWCTFHQGT